MVNNIEKFWADRGVKVITNSLGGHINLRRSYIAQFRDIVENSATKQSNSVKFECYSKLYPFPARTKYTGFENIKELDLKFRTELVKTKVTWPDAEDFSFYGLPNTSADYKKELITFLKSVENPLLYLSGGLDSELVARAMLEADIPFKVVIWTWTNKNGKILNDHDLVYAYDFCKANGLTPIVKTLDIETLWVTSEFISFARELKLHSPQLATYAWIVGLLKDEVPGATHLQGGEVRFEYYTDRQHRTWNILYLAKLPGLGMTPADITPGLGGIGVIQRPFLTSNADQLYGAAKYVNGGDASNFAKTQTYQYIGAVFNPIGSPDNLSNNFAPSPAYEIRYTSATPISSIPPSWVRGPSYGGGSIIDGPYNGISSSFTTIPLYPSNQEIGRIGMHLPDPSAADGSGYASVVYNIEVRGGNTMPTALSAVLNIQINFTIVT